MTGGQLIQRQGQGQAGQQNDQAGKDGATRLQRLPPDGASKSQKRHQAGNQKLKDPPHRDKTSGSPGHDSGHQPQTCGQEHLHQTTSKKPGGRATGHRKRQSGQPGTVPFGSLINFRKPLVCFLHFDLATVQSFHHFIQFHQFVQLQQTRLHPTESRVLVAGFSEGGNQRCRSGKEFSPDTQPAGGIGQRIFQPVSRDTIAVQGFAQVDEKPDAGIAGAVQSGLLD